MIIPNSELMPLIQLLLKEGRQVRFTITGSSMIPWIFPGDEILLGWHRLVDRGDIVLFEYPEGKFAIHRIVRKRAKHLWIRGDNQFHTMAWIPLGAVIGRVDAVIHRGRVRSTSGWLWRFLSRLWIWFFPLSVHMANIALYLYSHLRRKACRGVQ